MQEVAKGLPAEKRFKQGSQRGRIQMTHEVMPARVYNLRKVTGRQEQVKQSSI